MGSWVPGEWSDKLAKLPEKLADAQVARWQNKYGREPTVQQRTWLANKTPTDIAIMATELNAQHMHEKSLPPTGARRRMELAYQDWARLQGSGPRTGGPFDRIIGYNLTNEEFWCAVSTSLGITNPVCIPHIGTDST